MDNPKPFNYSTRPNYRTLSPEIEAQINQAARELSRQAYQYIENQLQRNFTADSLQAAMATPEGRERIYAMIDEWEGQFKIEYVGGIHE